MKISIVIPNYNDVRIERALGSVRSQTNKEYEIIVVDGLSSNQQLLDIYKRISIDHFIYEKDNGIFDALNKGVGRATGEIIYLMGSDDVLSRSDIFDKVEKAFNDDPDLDGVCIGCEFINSAGKVIRKWNPRIVTSKKILIGIYPPHFSLFLKKKLYDMVGYFDYINSNNIATDTLWLMDLALKKPDLKIKVINEVCLRMEYGGASTGSIKRILKQFVVVHKYAKKNKIHFWVIHSFVKSFSKIFQFVNI